MINTSELKKLLVYKNMKIDDVAKCIGKSNSTAFLKINGRSAMTLYEAEKIQELLGIPDNAFGFYFLHKECDL